MRAGEARQADRWIHRVGKVTAPSAILGGASAFTVKHSVQIFKAMRRNISMRTQLPMLSVQRFFTRTVSTLALTVTLSTLSLLQSASANDLVGKPAPAFSAKGSSGATYDNASLKGKVVVLEWFNNGCPFVQRVYKNAELPKLQKELTEKGVVYLVVNSTRPDHRDYLPAEKFTAVHDEWQMRNTDYIVDSEGSLGRTFEAKSTPTVAVIDKQGNLAYFGAVDNHPKVSGEPENLEFYSRDAALAALEEKPVKTPFVKAYGCGVKY